ncbi:MAG: hypothetical protein HYW26_01340 [Candidatus Aenigmarchaeota archaeon]|nr:hypothetical protein [Candidatus Aenigmarchaeota archaeon]
MARKKRSKDAGTLELGLGNAISLKCKNCFNWAKKKKQKYPVAAAGVVAAVIGGMLKATALTQTFPKPWDLYGNVILFLGLLLIVFDIMRGGLYD